MTKITPSGLIYMPVEKARFSLVWPVSHRLLTGVRPVVLAARRAQRNSQLPRVCHAACPVCASGGQCGW